MFVLASLLTNHHHSAFFLHSVSSLTFSLRATSTKSALLIPSKHIKQKLSERIIPLQAARKTPFGTNRKIKLPLLALGQGKEENGEMKRMNIGQEENQQKISAIANEEHNDETEISDEMKWESMYQQGNRRSSLDRNFDSIDSADLDVSFTKASNIESVNDIVSSQPPSSEVRVVTFDLDNTLWKTGPVIAAANNALHDYLIIKCGICQTSKRVEQVMKELYKSTPQLYNPSLLDADNDGGTNNVTENTGSPVYLTKLRIDSILELLHVANNTSFKKDKSELELIANEAFQVWNMARHAAIPLHYADSVLETLETLRQIRTSEGSSIVIGAITDGNSDPRKVQDLQGFFDFVVNAEGVGVSKPNRKIYQQAISEARRFPAVQQVLQFNDSFSDEDEDDNLMTVGPWWIHVGDDFMKDVVPAKEFQMRNIWSVELIQDPVKGADVDKNNVSTMKRRRDVAELMQLIASQSVVEMSIGTTDFLLDSVESEFVDCKAPIFSHVASIISSWHEIGLLSSGNDGAAKKKEKMKLKIPEGDPLTLTRSDKLLTDDPTSSSPKATSPTYEEENIVILEAAVPKKFCVYCGTANPKVAKFCFSCGKEHII